MWIIKASTACLKLEKGTVKMKKLIAILALVMVLTTVLSSCISRRPGESEVTTKDLNQILDELKQNMENNNADDGEIVAEVIYKAYDDHAEVTGCQLPMGSVSILAEFEGKKVTKIADNAFQGMNAITEIILPDSIESIGEKAFMSCVALTSVQMPAGLKTIGKYAFYGCLALTSLEIGAGVESVGENAFGSCIALSAISVADGNKAFSAEDGVLFSADKATLVQYPAGKADASYTIPASVQTVNNFAFSYTKALTSVDASNVTSLGDYTFSSCAALADVKLGSGLKLIGAGTFQKCTKLTSIAIPEGVVSLGYKNDAGAECGASFYGCSALASISLPSTIKNIYLRCFEGCDALTQVTYNGTKAEWDAVVVGEDNDVIKNIGVVTK